MGCVCVCLGVCLAVCVCVRVCVYVSGRNKVSAELIRKPLGRNALMT